MPKSEYKEVNYHTYCRLCKHSKLKDYESPCNECMEEFTNFASHVPVYFESAVKDLVKAEVAEVDGNGSGESSGAVTEEVSE